MQRRAGHHRGGQHRAEHLERVAAELAGEREPRAALRHRRGQHAGQVDRERDQAADHPDAEDPPGRGPVAGQPALQQAAEQHHDQHDRAVDVAHRDQQVAEHQRRQRVRPRQHRAAQRPPHPGQQRPDHQAGDPGGQVEVLRHPAQRGDDRRDVGERGGGAVRAGQREDPERPDAGEGQLDGGGEHQHVPRQGGQHADPDQQRAEQPGLALGGQVRGVPRVRVDQRPASVQHLAAEVVLPAQVRRLGVAVEEVAGLLDHEQQRGHQHREDDGEGPAGVTGGALPR